MAKQTQAQALHLKYRPKTFDELFGNEATVDQLRSMLKREKAGKQHAMILSGPSGCGKTTLARIIATELKCTERNIREYNVAMTRGIDTMRDIVSQCRYKMLSPVVYILDEAHMLTREAQNSILKILEDCPDNVYFILCTTNVAGIIETIRDQRCPVYTVSPLSPHVLLQLLQFACKGEGAEFPDEVLFKIAQKADGSPRKALVVLDKVMDMENTNNLLQAIESVDNHLVENVKVLDICRCLVARKMGRWAEMAGLLRSLDPKEEPEKVRHAILGYLSAILLNQSNDDKTEIAKMISAFSDSYMYIGKPGLVRDCYIVCTKLGQQ